MNKLYFKKGIATLAFLMLVLSPVYSQQIVPDGTTKTSLSQYGTTVNVTTNTVKGNSAFNSFVKFNVNKDNVVNLILPGNTDNLVNLVHGEFSDIQGTINSLKGNVVGGNLYLVNPHGMMVGPQGKINAGSLVALSPSKSFMSEYLDANGEISDAFANSLMQREFNVNPDAVITICGELNAKNNIEIMAGNIINHGQINSGAIYSAPQGSVDHADIVNINSFENAKELAVKSGQIYLVADNSIQLNGTVITGEFNAYAGGEMYTDKRAGGQIVANAINVMASEVNGPLYVDSQQTNIYTTKGNLNITGKVGDFNAYSAKNVNFSKGEANSINVSAKKNVYISSVKSNEDANISSKDGFIYLKASLVSGDLNIDSNKSSVKIYSSNVAGDANITKNSGNTVIKDTYIKNDLNIAQKYGSVNITKSNVGETLNVKNYKATTSVSDTLLNVVDIETKGNVYLSNLAVQGKVNIANTGKKTSINNSFLQNDVYIKQTGGEASLSNSTAAKRVTFQSDNALVNVNNALFEGKLTTKGNNSTTKITNINVKNNVALYDKNGSVDVQSTNVEGYLYANGNNSNIHLSQAAIHGDTKLVSYKSDVIAEQSYFEKDINICARKSDTKVLNSSIVGDINANVKDGDITVDGVYVEGGVNIEIKNGVAQVTNATVVGEVAINK